MRTKIIICDHCGKEKEKPFHRIRSVNQFCCHTCFCEFRKGKGRGEIKTCEHCHNDFYVMPYIINNGHGRFCCKDCQYSWAREFGPKSNERSDYKREIVHRRDEDFNFVNTATKQSSLLKSIRKLGKMHLWKKRCLERDGHQCVICGELENLQVHHKTALLKLIQSNKIKNQDQAHHCENLWDIDNGITLCGEHHKQFHEIYTKYNFIEANLEEFVGIKILKVV